LASLSDQIADRTITISGFSKSDGLSGLRAGYVHCENEQLFKKILEVSGVLHTTGGATVLSQVAAEAALRNGKPWRASFVDHLKKIIPSTATRLSELSGVVCPIPEGTFLLFPKVTAFGLETEPLAELILKEAKVAVVPWSRSMVRAGSLWPPETVRRHLPGSPRQRTDAAGGPLGSKVLR